MQNFSDKIHFGEKGAGPFINVLERVTRLSQGIKKAFHSAFKEVHYKRGTILLKEGKKCDTAYFMVTGIARLYYYVDGREITNRFIEINGVAISYYSFFSKKPSFEYIDLVEDSTMLSIKRTDLDKIYSDFPELHKVMQVMLQQSHVESEERAMILRRLSAKEKYAVMIERFPVIFLKATTEQLASFLGITRETLSRIRSGQVVL